MFHNINMFSINHNSNHNLPQIARESGFKFQENDKQNYKIDWRLIGGLDLDEIIHENDIERLEQVMSHVSDAPLGSLLKNSILDPAVSKYFILSQLCVQYLLFCKQFLDHSVTGMQIALNENEKELFKLHKLQRKKDSELLSLHKKLQYQQEKQFIYNCTKCTKNFNSTEMLRTHMIRKHSINENKSPRDDDVNLINTIKLELEVKQLKEKLNSMEKTKQLSNETQTDIIPKQDKFTQCDTIEYNPIGIQTNFEEVKEKNDIDENIKLFLENQEKHFAKWRNEENEKSKKDLNEMKMKLSETLNDFRLLNEQIINEELTKHRIKCVENGDGDVNNKYWKQRFMDLENLYSKNQEQMNQTFLEMDKKYMINLKKIEETVKIIENVPKRQTVGNEQRVTEPLPLVTRIESFDEISNNSLSSSDDESMLSDNDNPNEIRNQVIERILSQNVFQPKNMVTAETSGSTAIENIKAKSKIIKKLHIKKLFNNRLKELGINPESTKLSNSQFSETMIKLAENRETTKKKFKNFFITRNSILSKIDKLINKDAETLKKVEVDKPIPQPRKLIPIIEIAETPDHTSHTEIKQIDIKTSTPKPSTMYSLKEMEEESSDESCKSKIEEIPIQPKPIPRKRVIFNLDAKKSTQNVTGDDISDWDISSFSSDNQKPK